MKYVSLHHHTTYSYMDGYGTPEQHVARAAELGMTAIAATEHGNVSSHVGMEKACARYGLKFLPGLEAYTAPERGADRKFHLTILAMDQTGYASLNRLVTDSWREFFRWPTLLGETLAENADGLIVLSGCSDSLLACSLLGGKSIGEAEASWERAYDLAARFKALLGDRFYLECQLFPELERSRAINAAYERLGGLLRIPLVATADVHTIVPGSSEIRALLHAAGRGSNTIALQMSSWEYEVPDYIPTSDAEVFARACGAGLSKPAAREACRNTVEVASRINVTLPKAPRFRYPATEEARSWA